MLNIFMKLLHANYKFYVLICQKRGGHLFDSSPFIRLICMQSSFSSNFSAKSLLTIVMLLPYNGLKATA